MDEPPLAVKEFNLTIRTPIQRRRPRIRENSVIKMGNKWSVGDARMSHGKHVFKSRTEDTPPP